ncbi:MAG: zinc-ribbon domain-containing protein [Phycisphaeraceae bacterium]|nr:MAG: zinc-ribbon domain-containing protein [Phycisphaeraceae bacterium]
MSNDLYDDAPDSEDDLHPEGPSAADLERFGDEFRTCPECGSQVYDQAPLCPECGHAFEERTKAPLWLILTVVVVLAAFALVFVL